jgi:internalin A
VSCVGGDAAKLLERALKLVDERVERFGAKPTSRSTSLDRTREDEPRRAAQDLGGDRRDPAVDLRPGFAPRAQPELYVSYAWGDATPEGVVREKAVDDFCAAAEARGIKIIRDKTAMQLGDEIPKFMDRLVNAEQVFAFLSDKYLKSPYCMYDLFGIWRECRERGEEFKARAKFFVFPSAQIYSEDGIDGYQAHWEREAASLEAKIARQLKATAVERFARMKRFQRYATDIQHVLEFIRSLKHASKLDDFIADALRTLPGRAPSRRS